MITSKTVKFRLVNLSGEENSTKKIQIKTLFGWEYLEDTDGYPLSEFLLSNHIRVDKLKEAIDWIKKRHKFNSENVKIIEYPSITIHQ